MKTCGHSMPGSRIRCKLPIGHKGDHSPAQHYTLHVECTNHRCVNAHNFSLAAARNWSHAATAKCVRCSSPMIPIRWLDEVPAETGGPERSHHGS